ncbi:hypothetical protein TrCOL_g3673 [Triparma columacea]|uniref:PX domain-containing protein n=1 Tax=Triparma columacea TaxID=722753 RepID=A0A9W7LF92_9STRA|nr:hypothetical protein TrCOL_g3673 [Triparma columacea]
MSENATISCLIVHSAPSTEPTTQQLTTVYQYHIRILCQTLSATTPPTKLTLDVTVLRRYSEFLNLHTSLMSMCDSSETKTFASIFPPKSVYLTDAEMNSRLEALELYLQSICSLISSKPPPSPTTSPSLTSLVDIFTNFLDLDLHNFKGDDDGVTAKDHFTQASTEETCEYYTDLENERSRNRAALANEPSPGLLAWSGMLIFWLLCFSASSLFLDLDLSRIFSFLNFIISPIITTPTSLPPIYVSEDGDVHESVWTRGDLKATGWTVWGGIATWRVYWHLQGKFAKINRKGKD